jgi:hypothetical protein
MRSGSDYAHLLAAARHLDLTDVTCSGATATNILEGGQYFQGPQLDALRPDTELVTVTAGGNDVAHLGNLIAWSSTQSTEGIPWLAREGGICRAKPDEEVNRGLAGLPAVLARIASEVRRRSPHATLVFVDYTSILPEGEGCPDRLPLSPEQLRRGREVERALEKITADAAQESGALLVKASEVTRSHDICSSDPWVFGLTFGSPLAFGAVPYHPKLEAMRAIANAIDETLTQAKSGSDRR